MWEILLHSNTKPYTTFSNTILVADVKIISAVGAEIILIYSMNWNGFKS